MFSYQHSIDVSHHCNCAVPIMFSATVCGNGSSSGMVPMTVRAFEWVYEERTDSCNGEGHRQAHALTAPSTTNERRQTRTVGNLPTGCSPLHSTLSELARSLFGSSPPLEGPLGHPGNGRTLICMTFGLHQPHKRYQRPPICRRDG